MKAQVLQKLGIFVATVTVFLSSAGGADAVLISGQPARDAFEQAVAGAGYTKVDFNGYSAGTKLTTQIAGLSFRTIRDPNGNPISQPVTVASVGLPARAGSIVGTPCSGCSDDGRYAYEIVFTTPQRAAGIQRIWNASTITRFFAADGSQLDEFAGSAYVGWIAGEGETERYVKRIEIDGLVLSGSRQVGYSDDLVYGQGAIPEPATASLLALGLAGIAARCRRRV